MLSRDLFRSIHRLEDLPRLAGALGYPPVWRELPQGSIGGAGAAAVVAQQGDFQWYGVAGATERTARRAARGLAGRGLPAALLALNETSRRLIVTAGNAPALVFPLDAPAALDLARLGRCSARSEENALATSFRIAEALAGRGVDDRFFTGFRRALANGMAALPSSMPAADRHALTLLQLTRILFLYFIEAKGWLAGRPRFLREEVDRCLAARRSLQHDLLHPLFFGTLNRPMTERRSLARRFGALPFLNGGLFEPHRLERRWRVSLPTPVIRDTFDDLFERFHFTLSAPSGEAIAPDMLGRVFEGVMEPGERHATGSYYTPAALVDAMLRDALAAWLGERIGTGWPEAQRRLDQPDPDTRRALDGVRLLDPAVGSGAFLLGALRLITGGAPGPGAERSARLRKTLRTNLFGVDRNAAAVRLAELRLWLEVVAADPSDRPESVSPLPNLDALVRQGDSLVDPVAGLPIRPPRTGRAAMVARLRAAMVKAAGPGKRAAVAALAGAERVIATEGLESALQSVEAQIGELLDVGRSPTLFGEERGLSPPERARLDALREARLTAHQRLKLIERTGELPWFHYPTHFADVFARGGFDLVVGNPPWVRAEALEPDTRSYLAERYAWFRGTRSGARGYAHRPDLAVAFLERALELLAPRGVVAFLTPAKLATTGYAATAREALARRTTITVAADLRHDTRAGFDATVYPMALIATLIPPSDAHRVRLALGATEGEVPQRGLGAEPWVLRSEAAREALEQVGRRFPPLGARFVCHLGVKTGLNEAFLDPPREVEREVVRWAARGRDVRAFVVRRARRLLWPCDASGAPLERLPPAAARHLAVHERALRRRADHRGTRPWLLFRTGPASAAHRVIWADVARRLEAAPLTGRPGSETIPLNSCYVIPTRNAATALRLSAWLNSTWSRAIARSAADPASGGFARFNARVIAAIPCPAAALRDPALLELAHRGVEGRLVQEELDDRCAELLDLGLDERRGLAEVDRAGTEPGC